MIIDEIDCMSIDEYNHQTLLTSYMPFMENYSIILQLLWAYYKKLKLDDDQVINDNELQETLKKYLIERAKHIINKTFKTYYLIPMNDNAKNFAFNQVEKWVLSLINSLKIKKNIEYVINNDGKICPVDYEITGVIHKNMIYSNGLYQFLEMKNDLPVTPININTNYLSNVGFFRRYISNKSNNIYGLTGTIGDKLTMKLYKGIYELDFDFIPPNKMRLLKELESRICICRPSWIENIINIVIRETNANRAILIINKSIEDAIEIYEELIRKKINGLNIIKIIGEDKENDLIESEKIPKTVIVSTNISGRGMNLKLRNDIINNGGLHVIITFIPNNIRVEEQNYGRAGRMGQPGTWQLVINFQNIIQSHEIKNLYKIYLENNQKENLKNELERKILYFFSIDFLKEIREDRIKESFNLIINDIKRVILEDQLFNNYVWMLNQKKELREGDNKIYLDAIEEQWSIFLYNLETKDKAWEQIEAQFKNFQDRIFLGLQRDKDKIIKNPGFCNIYVNEGLAKIFF